MFYHQKLNVLIPIATASASVKAISWKTVKFKLGFLSESQEVKIIVYINFVICNILYIT